MSAAQLRREFDAAFAQPPRAAEEAQHSVLAIRIADDPYLLAAADIEGLHATPALVAVPSASAAFSGIVGLRGAVVPVFDLAALLGYPRAPCLPWLAVVGKGHPIALGLPHFESHLRLRSSELDVLRGAAGEPHDAHPLGGALAVDGVLHRLIRVLALVDAIRNRSHD